MGNSVSSQLGKGAGYLASLSGIATAGLFLYSAGLMDGLLWALLLAGISVVAAYAVWAERLVLVWPLALVFGGFTVTMVMSTVVLAGPVLYGIAAVLLTVDGWQGPDGPVSTGR